MVRTHTRCASFIAIAVLSLVTFIASAAPGWRTTYYANQAPFSTTLPLSAVPWSKYTHVIQAALRPSLVNGAPGIDETSYGIAQNKAAFVTTAHANGVKALVSVIVGPQEASTMMIVTDPSHLDAFVGALTAFVVDNGYDGIDLDWESVSNQSLYETQFYNLIISLRSRLPASKQITIAGTLWLRGSYARVQSYVDQINIMAYDLDGTYYTGAPSTVNWFNSCVRKPAVFADGNNKSQEQDLWYLLSAVPAAKVGLGIPFYGLVKKGPRFSGQGVTGPAQAYASGNASMYPRDQISYASLLSSVYWGTGTRVWDDLAKATYVSYDVADPQQDAFITYADQQQIEESIKLIREKQLGGVMTFAVAHEYLAARSNDNRYPLSLAMLNGMLGTSDINLAYGRLARQSSTFADAGAQLAVDGNTDGDYFAGSVTHTDTSGVNAWWEVDLRGPVNIKDIEVWNRTEAAMERLSQFTIEVLSDTRAVAWSSTQYSYPNPSATLNVGGVYGRYVRVSGPNILSLAEVKVHPMLNNVALGKPAAQSSTFGPAVATRAVDGDTTGNYFAGSVTHTAADQVSDWWQVDLQRAFNIGQIKIWNRTDCCADRLNNFRVAILDEANNVVWSSFQKNSPSGSLTLSPGGVVGRYVKVEGPDILSVAEVQVIEF